MPFDVQSPSQYDLAQGADNAYFHHCGHRNTMLFQIDEQQAEQLQKHQDKQNVPDDKREIDTLNHELAQMKELYSHCHKKYSAQAKYDIILYQLQVLTRHWMSELYACGHCEGPTKACFSSSRFRVEERLTYQLSPKLPRRRQGSDLKSGVA